VNPFEIGDAKVEPGATARLELPVMRLVTQAELSIPVVVVHGERPGPRLWLSAALHGDELNGTEIIRRVLARVKASRLAGTLVAVPVVNVLGFVAQSRYLPDRRDLNRSFPGSSRGSLASRLAHLFLTEIVDRCTHGIDLHTGSHHRANLPQVRGDLDNPEVRRCAAAFGAPLMIHGTIIAGTLREAAGKRGIPTIVYEAGEPMRFSQPAIHLGEQGVLRVIQELGMLPAPRRRRLPSVEVRRTVWVRSQRSGIVELRVALGDRVRKGQLLGIVRDAFGETVGDVKATHAGIAIGITNNPLLHRGEALVHLAVKSR
jgi:predicted deacylase